MNTASFQRVQDLPLRSQIREQLLDRIIEGSLPPGTPLIETDLGEKFGTSRLPVREAIQELAKDGWVELQPRRNARVHTPSAEEIAETFQVRAALQVGSVLLASITATGSQVEHLEKLCEEGMSLASQGEHTDANRLNRAFHRELTLATGNQILISYVDNIEQRIQWYFTRLSSPRGTQSWHEHKAIVAAISSGDSEQAASLMWQHSRVARDRNSGEDSVFP